MEEEEAANGRDGELGLIYEADRDCARKSGIVLVGKGSCALRAACSYIDSNCGINLQKCTVQWTRVDSGNGKFALQL